MKSELEKVILDQHSRVENAGVDGHKVLSEAKSEILAAATPASILEIIGLTVRHSIPSSRRGPISADFAAQRLAEAVGRVRDSGLFVPGQGYIGLIVPGEGVVAGMHASGSGDRESLEMFMAEDPIQVACGPDFLYPAMMWAKALYSEAYKNRPESQRSLPVHVWLAELVGEGLFQGSALTDNGLIGATGWMPSESQDLALREGRRVAEHMDSETIASFRASGLMDQMAVRLTEKADSAGSRTDLANTILDAGGSLN